VNAVGTAGVGKSQMVAQSRPARRHHDRHRLSQMEPSDLRGIPFPGRRRVEWAVPGILPDSKRPVSTASCSWTRSLGGGRRVGRRLSADLDRRLGEIPHAGRLGDLRRRQTAGRPRRDLQHAGALATAFSHYPVEAHLDDWVAWAYANGIDERLIAFPAVQAGAAVQLRRRQESGGFPSPRSWEFAHRALAKFGDRPTWLLPALQACVGGMPGWS